MKYLALLCNMYNVCLQWLLNRLSENSEYLTYLYKHTTRVSRLSQTSWDTYVYKTWANFDRLSILFTIKAYLFDFRNVWLMKQSKYDLDHGLRTPRKCFFFQKSRTFGLRQKFWAEIFWDNWGISIIQPLFLQKTKPSYPTSKYLFRIAYLLFWMNDNYHWPYIFPKEVIMVKMLTCEPNWAFSFYLFHVIYFTGLAWICFTKWQLSKFLTKKVTILWKKYLLKSHLRTKIFCGIEWIKKLQMSLLSCFGVYSFS